MVWPVSEKDGGPAFPQGNKYLAPGALPQVIDYGLQGGMTLRDWFAGKALTGMGTMPCWPNEHDKCAEIAYRYADAMLAERAK